MMYGEAGGGHDEQKQRLLDNTERVERTGRQLSAGYRIALETEEIGTEVLRDLHSQRETIQRTRSRVSIFIIYPMLFLFCMYDHAFQKQGQTLNLV
jgi:hypothetical protein